jgi:hypothetical protein
MHARHYSMLTGRFLSVDPLEGDPIAPQSFNLYGYVGNQPLTVTDQAGLSGGATLPAFGEAPDYILSGDTINVIDAPWQFAPGPNTGLWGLGSLVSGSLSFLSGAWSQVATGLRGPDFTMFNVNVGIPNPWIAHLVGISGTLSRDRYGHWYWSPFVGAQAGKSTTLVSGSLTVN